MAAPVTEPSRIVTSPACSSMRTSIGSPSCCDGEKSNSPLRAASMAFSTVGSSAIIRGPKGSTTWPSKRNTASPRICCMRAAALLAASGLEALS